MTPGDAYWVGVARPRKPTHTPPVVVSHRTIVKNNLPVSYLCIQPERRRVRNPTAGRCDTSLQGDDVSRRWRE